MPYLFVMYFVWRKCESRHLNEIPIKAWNILSAAFTIDAGAEMIANLMRAVPNIGQSIVVTDSAHCPSTLAIRSVNNLHNGF